MNHYTTAYCVRMTHFLKKKSTSAEKVKEEMKLCLWDGK